MVEHTSRPILDMIEVKARTRLAELVAEVLEAPT